MPCKNTTVIFILKKRLLEEFVKYIVFSTTHKCKTGMEQRRQQTTRVDIGLKE